MTARESYDTTTAATYRLDEADKTGQVVNSIPGLTESAAELVAAALRQGTAYLAGERTATVARELTAAELLAAAVAEWRAASLSDQRPMTRTGELAASLLSLAALLTANGDVEIEPTALRVAFRVAPGTLTTSTAPAATVDVLASLLAMVPESSSTAYGASRTAGDVGAPVHITAYGLTPPATAPLAVESAPVPAVAPRSVLETVLAAIPADLPPTETAAAIAAALGTTPPSADLNRVIGDLPQYKDVLKYTSAKVVRFVLLGDPRHVIAYDRPNRVWVVEL